MTPLATFLTARDYVSLALTRAASGHLALAAARVNGQEATLYLDTGAGQTLLDLAFAQRLRLPLTEDARRGAGAGGGGLALFQTVVAQLTLATFAEPDWACAVMDLTHVNAGLRQRGLAPMDGIIGGDLLQRREAVIDYRQSVLFLKIPPARAA
jgi:hypothetical protein